MTPWVSQRMAWSVGRPMVLISSMQAIEPAPGEVERVEQARERDDGRAVLVVVEHRDVEQLAQALLDDEAFGRLDVLQVDAAPALPQNLDGADELVRIL